MSSAGHSHVPDPYLYPGTSILRNRRDITDKDELAEAEAYFVETRLAAIGDLYEWAGTYRRTDFSKDQTQFWDFSGIETRLTKVLGRGPSDVPSGPAMANATSSSSSGRSRPGWS